MILTGDPLDWRLPDHVVTAVAVGVFDGVHRGHRAVIEQVVGHAHERGLTPAVLTFDPHPLEVLSPNRAPRLLSTIGQRITALTSAGADVVGVLPFPIIRDMAPDHFAREVLGTHLRAKLVAVGSDFRFGRDRSGDLDTLRTAGVSEGYELLAIDLVADDGHGPISSTAIRELLQAGEVAAAAELLGHPYELSGIVVEGDRRGRTIGFPTANLAIDERIATPADGVYSAWALCHEDLRPAVVNIGVRPTFDGTRRTIEAHLLEFDNDLYGKAMDIRFVERLRGEQRYDSVEDLVAQIAVDVENAKISLEVGT